MNVSVQNLAAALMWSAVAGLTVWFLLHPVRRRSTTGLLTSLVLVGAASSMGAIWGAVHEMVLPQWSWPAMIAISAFSGVVTAAAAVGVSRRLNHDTASLRDAVADVGAGRVPAVSARRLTSEIEQVRSELRETAAALAATREREQSLESARRELVSWVSHDLRTPLAGLRAMSEALEDGVAEDPELYYKQMGMAVGRLNTMVEDLFDLSRIQSGAVSRDTTSIALADLVSDCVTALEPLAAAQQVQLTGRAGGVIPIVGNAPELNRALTNLVANAIRHTHARGSVDVRVDVTSHPAAAGFAEVVVRDQCGGIPVEHLGRVFDVGFRGESARPTDSGAGLGLAITRGIVEAHDGTVDVENLADGCEFRVLQPLSA